jgi:signal transduction histidine kinase/FixJ family two-component response regulator
MMTEEELVGIGETSFMQEAIDCLPNGFSILNAEFLPLQVNRIARTAFDAFYAAVELGLTYREATFESVRASHPESSEEECWQMTDMREALLTSGKPVDIATVDGRVFTLIYRPMSGNRYVAVSVDVTETRKLATELETERENAAKALQSRSVFLANMSHEMRTPLNGIIGLAQEVERGGLDNEAQREHGSFIASSARSIKGLLDDVQDLAKIEAGQMQLAKSEEDLRHFLTRQQWRWRPLAEEKFLSFTLEVADDLPERLGFDAVRLGQCLSNVIANAIKFTDRGGVHIAAARYPHPSGIGVSITISDTGIGMSEEALANIFKPFSHAESAFSRRFGGRGLGVVMTQKLAQLMGGNLTAESVTGKGAVFTLTFLADPPQDEQSYGRRRKTDVERERTSRRGIHPAKKILLVDDHPLNRRVGRLYLEPEGFLVSEAVNGQQALDMLAEHPFDLVLLDIHMPVMGGLEAIRQIRGTDAPWQDIPVIAFTADVMSGDREHYLAEGMNGYVVKPIEKRDLLTEIGRVLHLPVEEQTQNAPSAGESMNTGQLSM